MKKDWFQTGFFAHGILNLSPVECYELCNRGAFIVDVREENMRSFKMFGVGNVIYLPFSALMQKHTELPKDKPLIFADTVGMKSRESVLFMEAQHYDNVANMAGGMVDWERDGLPVNTDLSTRLSGSCMCQLKARETKRNRSKFS